MFIEMSPKSFSAHRYRRIAQCLPSGFLAWLPLYEQKKSAQPRPRNDEGGLHGIEQRRQNFSCDEQPQA